MRVLITGSRNWTDEQTIHNKLNTLLASTPGSEPFILVHGHCPTGADAIADKWGQQLPREVTVERHPANWDRPCDNNCYHHPRTKNGKPYCPMAGHLRNQEMVDLGADLCLAFPLPGSRGTKDCIRRAKKANIPIAP